LAGFVGDVFLTYHVFHAFFATFLLPLFNVSLAKIQLMAPNWTSNGL